MVSPDVVSRHLCHKFKGALIILQEKKLFTAVDSCLILPCLKCTDAHQNFKYMYPQKMSVLDLQKLIILEKKIANKPLK